ncbi:MAG: alkylmercury lyase family protein [Candidatus Bathyarchaeia archaeon]
MSNSLYSVHIPANLRERLQTSLRLSRSPMTLGELGDLVQEYIIKCLKEPRLRAHFQAICKGEKIFGSVDYKTRHKVVLPDGRGVFVACALDALVEDFFHQIQIDSKCFHCGEPIRIRLSEGTINSAEPSSVVMWLGAGKEGDGPCRACLCPYINFFSSSEHVNEWKDKNPNEVGIMLTLSQSLELARKGYWNPLQLLQARTS